MRMRIVNDENSDKFTTPVKYPEETIIGLFVEGIVSAEWKEQAVIRGWLGPTEVLNGEGEFRD